MATCRIYFFTYKRNHLIPRAIQSLISQSFTDWTCEVHNDDPGDKFPATYIESLNDPRFIIKNHDKNLGGTASFNLAFAGCDEEFASILEDDNWWEPGFLDEMIAVLDSHQNINVAWSNMLVWREGENNDWENTFNTLWPVTEQGTLFNWPNKRQAMGALHSNGAILYRGKFAKNYTIPENCEFSMIEGVRERVFNYPIYLNHKVLANFSLTKQSARSEDLLSWASGQVLLLGSFIEASANPQSTFKNLLAVYRKQHPTPVATFFLVIFFILKKPGLIRYFNLKDWLYICKWLIKNAKTFSLLKGDLQARQNLYAFLLEHTALLNQNTTSQPS